MVPLMVTKPDKRAVFGCSALLLSAYTIPSTDAWEESCTQFKNIYQDGTALCENMWADSFEVVDDSAPGYTMWFFDQENNPNDKITHQLFGADTVPDQCHLNYFHKENPSPESDDMRECHPWKNNACCDSSTVESADKLNEAYGPGNEWDRCGPMSQACERFFVMEACMYECEPSAGLFRKYNSSQSAHPGYNEWQLHKMPIKKSFCDSWYSACETDYFCGSGDFFGCAANYKEKVAQALAAENAANKEEIARASARAVAAENAAAAATLAAAENEDGDQSGLKIGLIVAGAVAVLGLALAGYLSFREKQGNPVFTNQGSTAGVST